MFAPFFPPDRQAGSRSVMRHAGEVSSSERARVVRHSDNLKLEGEHSMARTAAAVVASAGRQQLRSGEQTIFLLSDSHIFSKVILLI